MVLFIIIQMVGNLTIIVRIAETILVDYEEYFAGTIETSDNSRSAKDLAFACFLARKGLTSGEISVVLREATYNQGKKLRDKYLERTIAKAMESGSEKDLPRVVPEYPKIANEQNVAHSALSPRLYTYSELKDTVFDPPEVIRTGIACLDEIGRAHV